MLILVPSWKMERRVIYALLERLSHCHNQLADRRKVRKGRFTRAELFRPLPLIPWVSLWWGGATSYVHILVGRKERGKKRSTRKNNFQSNLLSQGRCHLLKFLDTQKLGPPHSIQAPLGEKSRSDHTSAFLNRLLWRMFLFLDFLHIFI